MLRSSPLTPPVVSGFSFRRRWFWPVLVALVATVPVAGVFTRSRIFYVRDLTLAFRSQYLWLRHTVLAGQWPWWDPYPANGQSAAANALYQLFHPITLAIRLLLPPLIGFNVWVALPIPIAGLGAFAYLAAYVSPPAAALGALAYALSGPVASSPNFPNLSWSIATIPYVFWAIDRVARRRTAASTTVLAGIVGLQALAGEPVTLGATLAIAAVYALVARGAERGARGPDDGGARDAGREGPGGGRVRTIALAWAGLGFGVLLASIQFLPLLQASRASIRSAMPTGDSFWSFHPLAMLELVMPHCFGDYFASFLRELPWMMALNSGREPFYYTMYAGVPVLMLAGLVAFRRRGQTVFWTVTALATLVSALGTHTPLYPALQWLVPPLRAFRFPVKYLALTSFAVAVLAAYGWQALADRAVSRRALRRMLIPAAVLGCAAYALVAWMLIAPALPAYGFFRLARAVHVLFPIQGAQYLILRARPLLTVLFLKLLCAGFLILIAASARRERRVAQMAIAVLLVADLLVANGTTNPTIAEHFVHEPTWVQRIQAHPESRTYVGGRIDGGLDVLDIDAPKWASLDTAATALEQRYIAANQLVYSPSGWRMREAVSYDLPLLWPKEFAMMVERFRHATRPERMHYLAIAGVRYCVLPNPPFPGAVPLAGMISLEQMHLYDCNPSAHRASVVPDALIGPDVRWQIEGLFQQRYDPAAGVLVSQPPPPAAGTRGPAAPAAAAIVVDEPTRVVVRASLPADGYLSLADSYDPDWHVDVDGQPAPLMRANAIFRAVHLTRGRHLVTFSYHPRALYAGAASTATTILALAAWCVVERRRRASVSAIADAPIAERLA
ncbi:MAG TPA: YfhO family protein [Vicinamibacterales bacterium]|nr:YfhO family protein [Vicinamibacterales bacterium]